MEKNLREFLPPYEIPPGDNEMVILDFFEGVFWWYGDIRLPGDTMMFTENWGDMVISSEKIGDVVILTWSWRWYRDIVRGGVREKSRERMVYFPKLAQNHTHHQNFSIFGIFSTQNLDTHPYFFYFFPIFIQNLRTPPNFFPVIRLTLVKYITECLLSISY